MAAQLLLQANSRSIELLAGFTMGTTAGQRGPGCEPVQST